MIEAPGLAVEDVAICGGSGMAADQIDEVVRRARRVVRAREECSHGIFAAVAVEVADDHEIRITARGRIARKPVDEGTRGGGAGGVAVALTVAGVGVAEKGAARALRLQVGDGEREAPPRRELAEALRQHRAIA